MRVTAIARGALTFVPGVHELHRALTRSGGATASARYCYSVWMRHLQRARLSGLCQSVPHSIAELGPGYSIGVGLAGLLTGAQRYFALDALPLASLERNARVLEELASLVASREPIPDDDEFPDIYPKLTTYEFPDDLRIIPSQEIERISQSLLNPDDSSSAVRYVAPWWDPNVIQAGAVEMIFSQAVLEHVDQLGSTYRAMHQWLRPGGWMSHQIDFRSHNTANVWNGHWSYRPWLWHIIRGRRSFLINRVPHSRQIDVLRESGFVIVCDETFSGPPIARTKLAPEFAGLTDDDLVTAGAFVQARRLG